MSGGERRNKRLALGLVGVAAVMLSLSFAAVPLYNLFCKVTGFGGTTTAASEASDVILEQTIRVRFDASVAPSLPWEFHPVEQTMTIRIGETGLAFYEAYNPTDRVLAGAASFNVTPYSAGLYFTKIACFCFETQVLQPGERVQMPVTFYVDPDIINDAEAKFAPEITLSYTFHPTELPQADMGDTTSIPLQQLN